MEKEKRKSTKNPTINKYSLWNAFIMYLEKIYYPGALDKLDSGLLMHEYEYFKSQHLFN